MSYQLVTLSLPISRSWRTSTLKTRTILSSFRSTWKTFTSTCASWRRSSPSDPNIWPWIPSRRSLLGCAPFWSIGWFKSIVDSPSCKKRSSWPSASWIVICKTKWPKWDAKGCSSSASPPCGSLPRYFGERLSLAVQAHVESSFLNPRFNSEGEIRYGLLR